MCNVLPCNERLLVLWLHNLRYIILPTSVVFWQLYRPLNIYVALVGVEVWVDKDKIDIVKDADKTMNNFLDYRRTNISPKYRNDNAQLIT